MTRIPEKEDIFQLQKTIANCLDDILIKSDKFALLDFPDYANVGDSAIFCGQAAYFRRRGVSPSYISTANNFSQEELERTVGDGTIFLQGGGSFGSIWKWLHAFRERVIATNISRKIIQLPQTLYFDNQAAIDQTARVIEKHGDFTLMVRDKPSYDLAIKNFQCDVRLCPDMALALGSIRRKAPTARLLLHLREDLEAATDYDTDSLTRSRDVVRLDWAPENSYWRDRFLGSDFSGLAFAAIKGSLPGLRLHRYQDLADRRLRRGIDLLSIGEKVVTNRLHGHILCYLMDIPHCVIDNSYGKVSGFMNAWGTQGGNVQVAQTVEEAVALLEQPGA